VPLDSDLIVCAIQEQGGIALYLYPPYNGKNLDVHPKPLGPTRGKMDTLATAWEGTVIVARQPLSLQMVFARCREECRKDVARRVARGASVLQGLAGRAGPTPALPRPRRKVRGKVSPQGLSQGLVVRFVARSSSLLIGGPKQRCEVVVVGVIYTHTHIYIYVYICIRIYRNYIPMTSSPDA